MIQEFFMPQICNSHSINENCSKFRWANKGSFQAGRYLKISFKADFKTANHAKTLIESLYLYSKSIIKI